MTQTSFNRPHGPVTLAELTAGLIWPRLLGAFVLSIRPARWLMGTAMALLVWWGAALAGWLVRVVGGSAAAGDVPGEMVETVAREVGNGARGVLHMDWREVLDGASHAFPSGATLQDHWGAVLACGLILLPIIVVGGAAIARHAAVEASVDGDLGIAKSLVFGLRRVFPLMMTILIPLGLAFALSIVLKAAGWALLSLPGVSVVGALAFPLAVLLGLLYVLLLVGWLGGQPLLVPAVAVENADSVDALQRAYAYVFGRPLRTAIYSAVLVVQFAVGLVVVQWLVERSHDIAWTAATAFLSDDRRGALSPGYRSDLSATAGGLTRSVFDMWKWTMGAVVAGWALSFYYSGSTLLYVLLRRVHDEQDICDIWMPGKTAGAGAGGGTAPVG